MSASSPAAFTTRSAVTVSSSAAVRTRSSHSRPSRTRPTSSARSWITAPAARADRAKWSIRPWALTMPVLGEKRAPADGTWGSSERDSAAVIMRSSTPLAAPRERISPSAACSAPVVATMIFVVRRWGTPWRSQIS